MADRRCPNCGERVPSTNITCPKCYKKIPVEPQTVADEDNKSGNRRNSHNANQKIALLLSLIPGLFGILGLGLIYRNPRKKRGYMALVVGLLVFVAAMLLTLGLVTVFLATPLWIIYVLMYLGCLAMVVMDNISILVS